MQNNVVTITSSVIWTVPNDWSNQNKIQMTGGGGGGGLYSFIINEPGGGRLIRYGLGGAGGGYAEVTNLNILKPGNQITVTVAAGGGAGSNYGGFGGTTNFGGLLSASGGTVGTGSLAPKYGGSGIINLQTGTYDTAAIRLGREKFWIGVNTIPTQQFNSPGGRSGGNFVGGIVGGDGGNGQTINPNAAAQSGQSGRVVITYKPSGTHQACVWIS